MVRLVQESCFKGVSTSTPTKHHGMLKSVIKVENRRQRMMDPACYYGETVQYITCHGVR
jgi:hypothetical protein